MNKGTPSIHKHAARALFVFAMWGTAGFLVAISDSFFDYAHVVSLVLCAIGGWVYPRHNEMQRTTRPADEPQQKDDQP